jgi:hypothetical protein
MGNSGLTFLLFDLNRLTLPECRIEGGQYAANDH